MLDAFIIDAIRREDGRPQEDRPRVHQEPPEAGIADSKEDVEEPSDAVIRIDL